MNSGEFFWFVISIKFNANQLLTDALACFHSFGKSFTQIDKKINKLWYFYEFYEAYENYEEYDDYEGYEWIRKGAFFFVEVVIPLRKQHHIGQPYGQESENDWNNECIFMTLYVISTPSTPFGHLCHV